MRFFRRRKDARRERDDDRDHGYRRERDRYYDEELRDVYDGADYNEQARYQRSGDYLPHDYYYENYRFAPYDRQRSFSQYTPALDYGYSRDEYYPMDPAHHHYRQSPATGYGNDGSLQARDFDDWRTTATRHRNWEPQDYRHHEFPGHRRERNNDDFGSGLYDYRAEQQYQERFRGKRLHDRESRYRPSIERSEERRRHDRSDRHPVIVTPFKEARYYGRNDYNDSVGFGDREFVYHDDRRSAGDEGGDMSNG